MTKPTWRHMLRVLLPLLMMTMMMMMMMAAASEAATLTVTPGEAYVGDTVTIKGDGFETCTDRVEGIDGRFTLRSVPPGIELPSLFEDRASFSREATVSLNAAPGQFTIIASCPNLGSGSSEAQAELTVLVDPVVDDPSSEVVDRADTDEGVDSPTGTGPEVPQTPSIVVPPEVQLPAFGASSAWLLLLLGLALLLLLLAGLALQRWLLKRPPAVHVRPVAGVVVGPRVRATPLEQDGVRIVPHADPGDRVLSKPGREGR